MGEVVNTREPDEYLQQLAKMHAEVRDFALDGSMRQFQCKRAMIELVGCCEPLPRPIACTSWKNVEQPGDFDIGPLHKELAVLHCLTQGIATDVNSMHSWKACEWSRTGFHRSDDGKELQTLRDAQSHIRKRFG